MIPRHRGGTDEPSNLLKVNVKLHAFLHKLLWEESGEQYDFIAWKCLSGQITNEEANILATKAANTGRKLTEEQNTSLQDGARKSNKERLENGTHNFLDSEKQRELALRSVATHPTPWQRKETCEYCGLKTNFANYKRWHGDKCKHKKGGD